MSAQDPTEPREALTVIREIIWLTDESHSGDVLDALHEVDKVAARALREKPASNVRDHGGD